MELPRLTKDEMTAGQRWNKEKPTEPGWYWWRVDVQDLSLPDVQYMVKAVAIWETAAGMFVGGQGYLQDMDGEWQGPITPNEEA